MFTLLVKLRLHTHTVGNVGPQQGEVFMALKDQGLLPDIDIAQAAVFTPAQRIKVCATGLNMFPNHPGHGVRIEFALNVRQSEMGKFLMAVT